MDEKQRKFENYHIVLWLVKDLCWAMEFKTVGVIMIAPTIALAIYIAYRSFENKFEFMHNLAVCFWITANATWMTGEFFDFADPARSVAAVCFVIGIILILFAYWHKKSKQTTTA